MRATRNHTSALALMAMLLGTGADAAFAADRKAVATQAFRPARRVVVSIPDRKLAVIENEVVLRLFPVAVGSATSPSPVGTFTIVNRIDRPTYYAPGKVIPPNSRNPLGTRWLGLSVKGYGIHGTDVPSSIGHARSHGCIRLRNRDVEELFEMLRPGDVVEVHADRTPDIQRIFEAV
jgi:lipoprotein-anchoring transpeptidase ErfK/SrfK